MGVQSCPTFILLPHPERPFPQVHARLFSALTLGINCSKTPLPWFGRLDFRGAALPDPRIRNVGFLHVVLRWVVSVEANFRPIGGLPQ
jgi:hypothetical protein